MTSPTHPDTHNRRRTLVLAVAAVVVIVAVIVAFLVGRGSTTKKTQAVSTTSTTSSAPFPPASSQAALNVNGCLGGPDPTLAIGSAFTAPLTPTGAVEFTATLLRWLGDSTKTADQINTIGPKVVAPDLVSRLRSSAAPGTTTAISTENSIYRVQTKTGNSAVVQLLVTYKTTTASGTQTQQAGGPYNLGVKDGHWYLKNLGTPARAGDARSTREIKEIQMSGSPMAGGC